jgi:hypothetical protein
MRASGRPPLHPTPEGTVESKNQKDTVRIELTDEQKQRLREITGRDANAIEFSVQELEERIAPVAFARTNII